MTKILFLLPPSEWKNKWEGSNVSEKLSHIFEKPKSIATNATEKDLKCIGKRYEEWINLNKKCIELQSENYIEAIQRYSWVMYNAIWYKTLSDTWKKFFDKNFLIFSWMYWIISPKDAIWNYKLPIETRSLLNFWWDSITEKIQSLKPDFVVNLLPLSYQKMIDFDIINSHIINMDFYTDKDWELKKMTHQVKKVKWAWIRRICEAEINDYQNFGWKIKKNGKYIEIKIII
mgnify:CR=1 FL=1